jgi:hypothetical protein
LWAYVGVCLSVGLSLLSGYADATLGLAGDPDGDNASSLLGLIDFLALAAYVPGLRWCWRVSRNAHLIEPDMKHTPAATIWWHIVPIANLVMPYLVLAEVGRVSNAPRLPLAVMWGVFVASLLTMVVLAIVAAASPAPWVYNVYTAWSFVVLEFAQAPFFVWLVASWTRAQTDVSRLTGVFSDEPEPA